MKQTLKPFITTLLFFAFLPFSLLSQDTLNIMSYNILNFDDDNVNRIGLFKTIIDSTQPDVLIVQEILSASAVHVFQTQVLGSDYAAGEFINGNDSDNGIFYKHDLFNFIDNTPIPTALRDINQFTLTYKSTNDTLKIYSVHLKASSGNTNEIKRLQEVETLRAVTDALPAGSAFIICGDFNIYGANEPAYLKLIADNGIDDGHVIDPLIMPGKWNNPDYAFYHTQSTRSRQFGGGAHGGLDDRFDMILFSQAIATGSRINYVDNSTYAVGNDGFHHNDSINHPPNMAVSQQFADALHYASDHLPIMAKFVVLPGSQTQTIQIDAGWSGISSYLEPTNNDLETIVSPLNGKFTAIQNREGVFSPANGIQTINTWDNQSGYVIKLSEPGSLEIAGNWPETSTIQVYAGWNIIPFLTDEPIFTEDVFSGHLPNVEIVQEVAGTHIFWPAMGINTLPFLMPGWGYYLKSKANFEIEF